MPKRFKYKYKAVGDDIYKLNLIGLMEYWNNGNTIRYAVGRSYQELGNGWYGIVSVID